MGTHISGNMSVKLEDIIIWEVNYNEGKQRNSYICVCPVQQVMHIKHAASFCALTRSDANERIMTVDSIMHVCGIFKCIRQHAFCALLRSHAPAL